MLSSFLSPMTTTTPTPAKSSATRGSLFSGLRFFLTGITDQSERSKVYLQERIKTAGGTILESLDQVAKEPVVAADGGLFTQSDMLSPPDPPQQGRLSAAPKVNNLVVVAVPGAYKRIKVALLLLLLQLLRHYYYYNYYYYYYYYYYHVATADITASMLVMRRLILSCLCSSSLPPLLLPPPPHPHPTTTTTVHLGQCLWCSYRPPQMDRALYHGEETCHCG